MIRHLAQAEYLNPILPGQGAIQGEIDQVVTVGVEQDTVIGAPLVTMGQDILVKLPTLHIAQQKAERAFIGEYRKDSPKKQIDGRRMEVTGFQVIITRRLRKMTQSSLHKRLILFLQQLKKVCLILHQQLLIGRYQKE